MARATLDELEDRMNTTVSAILGSPISYTVFGQSAQTVQAHVTYPDDEVGFDAGSAMLQDITVEIDMAILPARPRDKDRIALPKRPGKVWKPVNVTRHRSGDQWVFRLKEVRDE
ncbi:MAG: hypothetical protein ACT6Q7_02865 [Blastomonas fulva]|uniref:hypothetical protein n=1 Tax=Blastomonas fulva TaxID=1550728 RepID=UPI004033AC49